jgi:hypothetical protein
VQSKYLLELLNIFENEKVFASFVFTFVFYNYIYNDERKYDLDIASYGIARSIMENKVGCYKGLPWIPKSAFFAVGKYYATH